MPRSSRISRMIVGTDLFWKMRQFVRRVSSHHLGTIGREVRAGGDLREAAHDTVEEPLALLFLDRYGHRRADDGLELEPQALLLGDELEVEREQTRDFFARAEADEKEIVLLER